MKTIPLFLLLFFIGGQGVHAQSAGLPVVVQMQKGDASEMILLGRADRSLRMQSKGVVGSEIIVPLNQIVEIRFVFPPALQQAQQALQLGQLEKAASLSNLILTPMLPYLDLPNNNAAPLVLTLADLYRRINKFNEAIAFY